MLPVIRFLIIISLHIFLQLSLRLINLIVLALRIIYVFFRYLLHSVKEVVTGAITTGKEFKPVFSAKETKKEKPKKEVKPKPSEDEEGYDENEEEIEEEE